MAVITTSRRVGSLATEIARGAAADLNYGYVDKDMLGKIMASYGIATTLFICSPLQSSKLRISNAGKGGDYEKARNGMQQMPVLAREK